MLKPGKSHINNNQDFSRTENDTTHGVF